MKMYVSMYVCMLECILSFLTRRSTRNQSVTLLITILRNSGVQHLALDAHNAHGVIDHHRPRHHRPRPQLTLVQVVQHCAAFQC